jgi:hypothetical protein
MANAICERLIGTIGRECLDWLIPMSQSHLRSILTEWGNHYNRGRAHMSLGPGVPDPPTMPPLVEHQKSGHRLGEGLVVHAASVLSGCITSIHSWRGAPDAVLAEDRTE